MESGEPRSDHREPGRQQRSRRAPSPLTAATNRGAPCRKSGSKRAPSAQPSRHCPALDATRRHRRQIDFHRRQRNRDGERRRARTRSAARSRCATQPPIARRRHQQREARASNVRVPGTYAIGAVHAEQRVGEWAPIVTTIRMRRLCADATRSTRAPKRSPSTDISAAPPGTLAKIAVVRSMTARRASARRRRSRARSRIPRPRRAAATIRRLRARHPA